MTRHRHPPRPQPHPGSDYNNRGCRCENCKSWNRDQTWRRRLGLSKATRGTTCTVTDCTDPQYAKQMCHFHYNRYLNGRSLDAPVHGTQTACIYGHEFTPSNTYITKTGRRSCRTCDRLRHRGNRAQQRTWRTTRDIYTGLW